MFKKMIDAIIKIIVLLKPRFYNKLASLVVLAGIGLLSSPLLERIINAIFQLSLNISITDKNDTYIGLALIVIGLIYHLATHYLTEIRKVDVQEQHKIESRKHLLIVTRSELSKKDFDSFHFRESVSYSRLRPFLNEVLIKTIESDNVIIQAGGRGGGANNFKNSLLDELARLESEWNLI